MKVINLNKKKVSFGLVKFVKIVNNYNPEYIFSTLGNLNIAICVVRIFFKRKVKIIVRETNFLSKNINQNKFSIIWKVLYKIFLKKSDKIIALSESIKADLIKNFKIPKKKIKVIYNPVNFKNISKLSKLKCKLDLTTNGKYIRFLACGSLSYKKGFDILIDALKFVNNKNYKLLILGSGPEEKNLKKKVKNLNLSGHVKFVKFLKNPYPVMQASDAIIISSRHEGCSNVMLEGLLLKKPIISVPCDGANVEILQNKKNCFISKDCSSLSLSKTINVFLLRKNKNNKTFLEKKFETNNVVKEYQNLILNT